jgi:hypothetical protein
MDGRTQIFLQIRNMENVMQFPFIWNIKGVSNLIDYNSNLIGPIELRRKFVFLAIFKRALFVKL